MWRIGDTENITFTTVFDTYTIALWQQKEEGGGANLGPIIFQLGPGQKAVSHFVWNVQIFNFDLEVSPTFFMWIFNGSDASSQGKKLPSVSSAYFTIKEALPETSPTTTPATSTTLPSATTAPVPPSTTTTPAASTDNNVTSTVVPISVGVSVGVVALAVLGALLFWFIRRRRKRQQQQAPAMISVTSEPPTYYHPGAPPPPPQPYACRAEGKYAAPPVELHANPERAELS